MTRHDAPGHLELVRRLLNTWVIANETHAPEERLPALVRDASAWRERFAAPRPRTMAERDQLILLRDDLRAMVTAAAIDSSVLNAWLERIPLRPRVDEDGVVHEPMQPSLAGVALAAAVDALAAGHWARLKACDDCQWVFFDWTRNDSRRWCGMLAEGPEGRACGSIAKVRRYRQRQRERLSE
jgi:predicted RNA-binding Zn ribbon-like protein